MIRYAAQKISKEDIKEVRIALKNNFITQGKQVDYFEKKISQVVDSKYCLSLNSASSALLLACKAIGLKKNDIGWTTTNTFAATANAILLCDAKVDFVDIDIDTFNISVVALEKKLKNTKKNQLPKVLIIVHFGGSPCELKKIFKLSKKYKFRVIEDASHALGASYEDNKIGNCKYSDITIFSFHAIKIITTCEGGAITTNNPSIYNKIKLMRTNGISREVMNLNQNHQKWYYEQKSIGYNFRLNEIQAALGRSQIKKIKLWIRKRNQISKMYKRNLKELPIKFQKVEKIQPHHTIYLLF